jgi:hypothetical protein
MVREGNNELKAKQETLLAELRRIVGNKKLMFSDCYIKARCNKYPTLGAVGSEMSYYGVSRKSVFCPCRVLFGANEGNTEIGVYVKKYSLYKHYQGQVVKKIDLEDLFVRDLEKVLDDIKYFLWWEAETNFPHIEKLYKETLAYKEKYNKLIGD